MASRREIARDWGGVAKSYVDRCVTQRGCPTSSLEEARKWREENARRRAPTDQKSIARAARDQRDNTSPEDSTLISLAAAKDKAFRGYDAVLDLILELPKSVAAQCNPADPEMALTVLESECTGILCDAWEVYAAWSKIRSPLVSARNSG
jgi:hypothetical protein